MASEKQRQKIVDALMKLVSDRDFASVKLGDVAEEAGVTLGQLRGAYDGTYAILEDFYRRIDAAVLAEGEEDEAMAGEPAGDRLFDVLMRRLDALAPHKAAIAGLMRAARRDPLLAAALNTYAVTSHRWMLTAAGLDRGGLMGLARAQAVAIAFAQVVRVWLEEEDPGLPKTMAALDKGLKRLGRIGRRVARVEAAFCRMAERRRGRRGGAAPEAPEAATAA